MASLCISTFGCSTVNYYGQSVAGHTRLMLAREDINSAILKAEGDKKRQLELAKKIRQFAVSELKLPSNNSYLSYVDLQREYPVWSVVAAEEFSLAPKTWCYPVIGCAAYRGYFSEENAQTYAKGLQAQGLETHVGGAAAYSTLGWFSDPLIPSMMRNGDMFMAQIMFHELAHQQLYIKGNSAFNEAFATVVGEWGAVLWLQQNTPESLQKYQRIMSVRNDFSELIKQLKVSLKENYGSNDSDLSKRAKKQQILAKLNDDYEQLVKYKWQGKRWYSAWFSSVPNNAKLVAFATYRDLVPAFEKLLNACENNFSRFYQVVALQKGRGQQAKIATSCDIQ